MMGLIQIDSAARSAAALVVPVAVKAAMTALPVMVIQASLKTFMATADFVDAMTRVSTRV
jgi:hypothetical protein